MATDQIVKSLIEIFNSLFVLAGIVATAIFGYRQWRGGKRHDEIGSAAEHIVASADKLIDMKDEEIQKLLARLATHEDMINRLQETRDKDREALTALEKVVDSIKIELQRADTALEYLVSKTAETFPEEVATALRIRRGEAR